jgi:hypothetical protein
VFGLWLDQSEEAMVLNGTLPEQLGMLVVDKGVGHAGLLLLLQLFYDLYQYYFN